MLVNLTDTEVLLLSRLVGKKLQELLAKNNKKGTWSPAEKEEYDQHWNLADTLAGK